MSPIRSSIVTARRDAGETSRRSRAGRPLQIEAARVGDPRRGELETYVCARFAAKHGAQVRSFMPTLLAFCDERGELCGVAGVRGAGESILFLEHYLDQPVDVAIGAALARSPWPRRQPGREEIVEVGNLAGVSCRAAARMVAQLPAYLRSQRYGWIVFTATAAVRQILAGFGAPLLDLGRAERSKLGDAPDDWGRYYDADPRICAGDLRDADRLPGFSNGG